MSGETRGAKVLLPERWDDGTDETTNVSAETIAEHVREGWTVEAVQWSETPGEALCVVLGRS